MLWAEPTQGQVEVLPVQCAVVLTCIAGRGQRWYSRLTNRRQRTGLLEGIRKGGFLMTVETLPYTIIDARYAGTCKRCKGPISAGQLIRYYFDKHVEHALPGECSGPVTQVEAPVPAKLAPHDGFYTVVIEGDRHYTFCLATQDDDADFAPGQQIMSFLGADAEYIKFAFITGGRVYPWKRFKDGYGRLLMAATYLVHGQNYETAGKLYALESGNCYRCGRVLTNPESIAAGIGPYCAGKA